MTTSDTTRLRALCAAALAAKGSPGAAQVVREVLGALPALLDRVEAAEARVAELGAQGLALAEDARAAYAQRREMGREAQRLREIIAGRTTPPTAAEILAHDADGGVWLLTWEHDGKLCADATRTLAQVRAYAASRPGEYAYRWRAIGRDGRPCAWPVVTEVSRG